MEGSLKTSRVRLRGSTQTPWVGAARMQQGPQLGFHWWRREGQPRHRQQLWVLAPSRKGPRRASSKSSRACSSSKTRQGRRKQGLRAMRRRRQQPVTTSPL